MEAQIAELAINAGRAFLNPVSIAVPAVGGLALVTGVAARVADFFELQKHGRSR
ncbi:MAG: hypothetical protein GY926_15560 [bacterium]|nr:hypothetical protein [bacterium]MCP4966632.1 hypothetical protein [bacterium]